jgi:hypothetical protein
MINYKMATNLISGVTSGPSSSLAAREAGNEAAKFLRLQSTGRGALRGTANSSTIADFNVANTPIRETMSPEYTGSLATRTMLDSAGYDPSIAFQSAGYLNNLGNTVGSIPSGNLHKVKPKKATTVGEYAREAGTEADAFLQSLNRADTSDSAFAEVRSRPGLSLAQEAQLSSAGTPLLKGNEEELIKRVINSSPKAPGGPQFSNPRTIQEVQAMNAQPTANRLGLTEINEQVTDMQRKLNIADEDLASENIRLGYSSPEVQPTIDEVRKSAQQTVDTITTQKRAGYEPKLKDTTPDPSMKSNNVINKVSSSNAGAGAGTPGDMGYAGFSGAFERHASGAVIGAGMGMMSEGEVSMGGAARGAMFGIAGGKAARMFTGSMRGGAVNSMARGVGDTLSAAENGTMRKTAGDYISGAMSGFDGAKSQEAMRMATFAGAGLAGFSMGRDRNHSRGMNGSRGSRF